METVGTVTVAAGAYATVRAVEKARKVYGPDVTVRGIVNESAGRYEYEVVRCGTAGEVTA